MKYYIKMVITVLKNWLNYKSNVFCIDCKYLNATSSSQPVCFNKNNTIINKTYYTLEKDYINCCILNKYNNCRYYEISNTTRRNYNR